LNNSSNNGLRKRVLRASSWTMSAYVVGQVLRLGGNLIVTRLLVPEMFGVMGIVAVILMGLTLFSDVGLLQNVVRSQRGEESKFLNTAWVVQIGRGGILCVVALLISWLLQIASDNHWLPSNSTYADPVLPLIIAVMSIQPLIEGFISTNLLVANRRLQFGRVAALEFVSQATGLLVMVVWAWIDRTIWALVIGSITMHTVKMILSHIMIPGAVNRFEWDSTAFYEIFNFGKWIFVATIFGFLMDSGDRLLLGGLVSAGVIGVYSIAFFLASAATVAILKVTGTVFFSALSEVARDNSDQLAEVYYKMRKRIDSVAFFGSGFIFISGSVIIEFLYDDRYLDAGWMLEILSLSMICVGYILANQCFLALGRAKTLVLLTGIQVIVLFISLPLSFYYFGMLGAVWAVSLTSLFRIIGTLVFMKKYQLIMLRREFVMVPLFFVGAISGAAFEYVMNLYI